MTSFLPFSSLQPKHLIRFLASGACVAAHSDKTRLDYLHHGLSSPQSSSFIEPLNARSCIGPK